MIALVSSKHGRRVIRPVRPDERQSVTVYEGSTVGEPFGRVREKGERLFFVTERRVCLRCRRTVRGPIGKILLQLLENAARFLVAVGLHECDREAVTIGLGGLFSSGRDQRLEVFERCRGLGREPNPQFRSDQGEIGALPIGPWLELLRAPAGIRDARQGDGMGRQESRRLGREALPFLEPLEEGGHRPGVESGPVEQGHSGPVRLHLVFARIFER